MANIQDNKGNSPLHIAAINLNLEAVVQLLNNSAIVNLMNKQGQTPLDLSPAIRNIMLEHVSSPPAWIEDEMASNCQICEEAFTFVKRRVISFSFLFFASPRLKIPLSLTC